MVLADRAYDTSRGGRIKGAKMRAETAREEARKPLVRLTGPKPKRGRCGGLRHGVLLVFGAPVQLITGGAGARTIPLADFGHIISEAGSLLNHSVGHQEHLLRDSQSQCFGRPEIDHELKFGRLLNRQVRWIRAL
jgi:hypothetical protein